jgi:hypothetical protein
MNNSQSCALASRGKIKLDAIGAAIQQAVERTGCAGKHFAACALNMKSKIGGVENEMDR